MKNTDWTTPLSKIDPILRKEVYAFAAMVAAAIVVAGAALGLP